MEHKLTLKQTLLILVALVQLAACGWPPATPQSPGYIPDNSPQPATLTSTAPADDRATRTPTTAATSEPVQTALPGFPPPLGEPYAVVGVAPDDVLNVRSGAGVANPVIGALPFYTLNVAITGDGTTTPDGAYWAPISYGELSGWVNTAFLAPQVGSASPELARSASQVIHALNSQDMDALAKHVHPARGLRFSAYSYVSDEDLLFGPEKIKGLFDDPGVSIWGRFDGTGDPIQMTFAEYFSRFVYDVDFARPEKIGFNQFIGSGNTINNLPEFYPEAEFVEYHFSGFDAQYGGMDWRSLRLAFEQVEGEWYLVGVIHDEWTI